MIPPRSRFWLRAGAATFRWLSWWYLALGLWLIVLGDEPWVVALVLILACLCRLWLSLFGDLA